MSGAIFETYVVSEIIKSYWHHGRQAPIYYYRDKDQKEIDLLIVQNNTFYPIEIKKTASPRKEMISSFKAIEKFQQPIGEGGLICLVDTLLPLSERVSAIPVSVI